MPLSIRGRLTSFYLVVLLVVLLTAGVAVLVLHARLGLARVDAELDNRVATFVADLYGELEEGLPLEVGAEEVADEIELPGTGVAVVDAGHTIVAFRSIGQDPAPSDLVNPGLVTGTLDTGAGRVRVRPVPQTSRGGSFRVIAWTSLAPFENERSTLFRSLALGVPLVLLLAAAAGWSLSRRALQPLEEMARQTESISDQQPEARLRAPHPTDELGTLAQAFNDLLDRLSGALQQQRRFMADASHELRTPVSVTRTTAQVTMRRATRTEDEYREALSIVSEQSDRMSKMVDDMLVLALADAGGRPLQPTDFYLDELVHECAKAVQVLGEERRVDLEIKTPGEVLFRGDETLLRQLLLNLLDNAVRYGSTPGRVSVVLEATDAEVRIDISDSGSGIPAIDRERIFERFVRLDQGRAHVGGGLGLPIARWVAEAHGGRVTAEPPTVSGGRFLVVLPRSISRV